MAVSKPRAQVEVRVEGRTLRLTNLEKPLYPSGFTKAEVLRYYSAIAPALLPHLQGRALTVKRYPEGSTGPFFYEKHAPRHRPAWIKTVHQASSDGGIDFTEVDGLPALTWLANLAALELHTPLALAKAPERPTALAFDLDPGAPADVLSCAAVALAIRDLLAPLKLRCYPKTSGNKGMQVYAPLSGQSTYEETKRAAHAIAKVLEARQPDRVVSAMKKSLREGKVFIDWSQNDAHKTTICVYSLRARERPFASTPLRWSEVEAAVQAGDPAQLRFEADEVLRRVATHGDLFAPVLAGGQQL